MVFFTIMIWICRSSSVKQKAISVKQAQFEKNRVILNTKYKNLNTLYTGFPILQLIKWKTNWSFDPNRKKAEMYLQMKLIKTGQNRNCCCCCNKFEKNCKIISSEFKENVINALYKVVAKIVKGLRYV